MDDIILINTNGLSEGIRCSLCKNPIKSDRGCDGNCNVNEEDVSHIMEVVDKCKVIDFTEEEFSEIKSALEYLHDADLCEYGENNTNCRYSYKSEVLLLFLSSLQKNSLFLNYPQIMKWYFISYP